MGGLGYDEVTHLAVSLSAMNSPPDDYQFTDSVFQALIVLSISSDALDLDPR